MIREVMKICGLDCDETCEALGEVAGLGVDFEVEENCLDVKITMTSELDKKSFDAVKSRVYNIFSEQVYSAARRRGEPDGRGDMLPSHAGARHQRQLL